MENKEKLINILYSFRTKKYGKWEKGNLEVSCYMPRIEYMNTIKLHLESQYPESNRIEIQNIRIIYY
jgi:hypothetical protein